MCNTCNTSSNFGRCGGCNGCGCYNQTNGCYTQRVCRDACGNLRIQNVRTYSCNNNSCGWLWGWLSNLFSNTNGCCCNNGCSYNGNGCGTTAQNGNTNATSGCGCGCGYNGSSSTNTAGNAYYARQYGGYRNGCGCCSAYDHYIDSYTATTAD